MTYHYYEEQAGVYDNFDLNHPSRQAYTSRIEELVGEDLQQYSKIEELLSLACGTGRRSLEIRKLSGHDYRITGVDLSENMCRIAQDNDLITYNGHWIEVELPPNTQFDAAICLYSFSHLPDEQERVQFLEKLHRHLKTGAPFYLDVFNINDKNEWGPRARRNYDRYHLAEEGYREGDVFYKKTGGQAVAFLHYFEEEEICELLESTGFKVVRVWHVGYVKKSGQLLDEPDEGALFIKAEKPG